MPDALRSDAPHEQLALLLIGAGNRAPTKKPPSGGFFALARRGALWHQAARRCSIAGLGRGQFLRQVMGQLLEQLGVQLELGLPCSLVDAGDRGELFGAEVQAAPVEVRVARGDAE